jgi:hypothetical protein
VSQFNIDSDDSSSSSSDEAAPIGSDVDTDVSKERTPELKKHASLDIQSPKTPKGHSKSSTPTAESVTHSPEESIEDKRMTEDKKSTCSDVSPPTTMSTTTESLTSPTQNHLKLVLPPLAPSPSCLANNQSTMWLGTEDGCIHVYNCNDNIRIKKNKIKIQLSSTVNSIVFVDNKVFAGLSNGQLVLFKRDEETGSWLTSDPHMIDLSSSPVLKLLAIGSTLWCASQNKINIFDTSKMEVVLSFHVSVDVSRVIQCMVSSGLGVWVSTQSSPIIRLYHASTYECLLDINVAPAVSKILSSEFCHC